MNKDRKADRKISLEFHPAVESWFSSTYSAPTECQVMAWAAIQKDQDVLVAAPTGSGKTLAAFLAAIDELVKRSLEQGALADETHIVYVSPLKALSYDIEQNLKAPLAGIRRKLADLGYADAEITTAARTGDTSQAERQKMARRPPHILVTTPESLYLLLTSDSGRNILRTARKVIVDEIHSLIENKRGAHFALSMARLAHVAGNQLTRVGLSATQRPADLVASYLTGQEANSCVIVDAGHIRKWDLAAELPPEPLAAVLSSESWARVYARIAELVSQHGTTLIFVNTRRHAERATRHLAEILGEENVAAHHGSLSKEHRRDAETRLKSGMLNALVATASLELGIDIGDIDLVCQIGSPRSISVFIQRVGRSGHAIDKIPKGRIFPTTRDELVESAALLKAVREGRMEQLGMCRGAMDVLAQQVVAETSVQEWDIDRLMELFASALPYRGLELEKFETLLVMLSEGYSLKRGRRNAYIHLDAVNRVVRARKGARIVALTNGGAIPDQFDYDVILAPDDVRIGSVNEDFAFESLKGDIFQLGNASYRVLSVRAGKVLVEDAKGLPPNIPFWIGEGRGRSDALSDAVSGLRREVSRWLSRRDAGGVAGRVETECGLDGFAAAQVVEYLAAARHALGELPTKNRVVYERFFDEMGDAHLVVHSVYGSRINRAWGLALRKKFCVRFDFELQASALEDSLVLSLGPTHSFDLPEVGRYLKSANLVETLTQALFTAPMFPTRWRWVVNTALAVPRNRNGKKVPPQLQRMDAEDLLAVVFPDQVACQENRQGPVRVPEHPLVEQAIEDCLHEVMDADGLVSVLRKIESGEIDVLYKDLPEPSVLAHEILTARPYAFLDDAPAEERRTAAVQTRRRTGITRDDAIEQLDPDVIDDLRAAAWPNPSSADQLHEALVLCGFIAKREARPSGASDCAPDGSWAVFFEQLTDGHRACEVKLADGAAAWVAAERLAEWRLIFPGVETRPDIEPASIAIRSFDSADQALDSIMRSRLEIVGPTTSAGLARSISLDENLIDAALLRLEAEGTVMRGSYTGKKPGVEWCDRRFLARIHKQTIKKLRKQIKPVSVEKYLSFLTRWMRADREHVGEGADALNAIFEQLEGFEAPAVAWESDLLPARMHEYRPELLDQLSASGAIVWSRISPAMPKKSKGARRFHASLRNAPLAFLQRRNLQTWRALRARESDGDSHFSSMGRRAREALQAHGALFVEELCDVAGMLPSHVEEGLVELFTAGLATCDHFGGIRSLLRPESGRARRAFARYRLSAPVQASGRWSLIDRVWLTDKPEISEGEIDAFVASALLRRYGIVFKEIAVKESRNLPPWHRLRRVYRTMEDRGEVRGGRFVTGLAGEQFALPEAVESLRRSSVDAAAPRVVTLSATDPLNMTGVLTPGERISAFASTRIQLENGVCVGVTKDGQTERWPARDGCRPYQVPG